MKKAIGLFILFSLCVGASAQEIRSFGRLGIGAGTGDRSSHAFAIEYGKLFRHLEFSLKFSYFNIPINDMADFLSIYYIDREGWPDVTRSGPGINGSDWGGKNLSLTLNAGYNLLHLIGSGKHNFTPYVALGYGSWTKVGYNYTENNSGSLTYSYNARYTYGFGARYEYGLNDKLRLGAYYELCAYPEEWDILGLNISRVF